VFDGDGVDPHPIPPGWVCHGYYVGRGWPSRDVDIVNPTYRSDHLDGAFALLRSMVGDGVPEATWAEAYVKAGLLRERSGVAIATTLARSPNTVAVEEAVIVEDPKGARFGIALEWRAGSLAAQSAWGVP
jgi:hypothetical protein